MFAMSDIYHLFRFKSNLIHLIEEIWFHLTNWSFKFTAKNTSRNWIIMLNKRERRNRFVAATKSLLNWLPTSEFNYTNLVLTTKLLFRLKFWLILLWYRKTNWRIAPFPGYHIIQLIFLYHSNINPKKYSIK